MNPRLRFKKADGTEYPDWEEKKLGELIYPTGSKNKNNLDLESFSINNEKGFVSQKEQFENAGYLNNADRSRSIIVSPNSFAYNPARINIGSIGYQNIGKDVLISPLYEVFKTTDKINDKFLMNYFRTKNFKNNISLYSEGSVRFIFSFKKMCLIDFNLPCLEEQEKIGNFLSDIDEVILASDQEVKKLQELKKGAMQKIFSQEIRFKKSDGTNYPNWEEKKLTDYLEFKNGINANRDSFGTGIKLISVSDILNNDYITYDVIRNKINIDEKTKKLYEVNYGDILFQRCSETLEEAGSANVYLDNQTAVFGGFVIRGKKIGEYNPIFFNHLLKSSSVRMEIKKKAQGAQHINIGQDLLSTIIFFIPCLEEQQKIGDFLSDFDEAISLAKQELEKWKLLKKGLLQQMFI